MLEKDEQIEDMEAQVEARLKTAYSAKLMSIKEFYKNVIANLKQNHAEELVCKKA